MSVYVCVEDQKTLENEAQSPFSTSVLLFYFYVHCFLFSTTS